MCYNMYHAFVTTDLKAEIKQTAAFVSLEQESYLNLVRTASLLEHGMAEGLKQYGLTLTQYNTLRILRGAGAEGFCRREIQARMLTPVPDATRLLDRLSRMGFVVRDRDGGDRRFVTTRITQRGLDKLRRLDAVVAQKHKDQLGHLSAPGLRRLVELLEKARARIISNFF